MMHPSLKLSSRKLIFPIALGVLVRLVLLILAGDVRLLFDEVGYAYFAEGLVEHGSYDGVWWPPGYSAIISLFLHFSDTGGLYLFRIVQVFCSGIIGFGIVQLSHLLFGDRGALLSGYAWALYLPEAFYSHRIWPETLFLTLYVSSMYLLLSSQLAKTLSWRRELLVTASGLLLGLSLYLKESVTYLPLLLAAWLLFQSPRCFRIPALFLLSVILVVLPLTIRNYHRFQAFVPVAAGLSENLRVGMNAQYRNFDYNNLEAIGESCYSDPGKFLPPGSVFTDYGPGWRMSHEENIGKRTRTDVASAVGYLFQHKTKFLLTRIKKAADYFTPLSFMIRDLFPYVYGGPLSSTGFRYILIPLSLASVMLLLSAAWVNFVRLRNQETVFSFFATLFLYHGGLIMLASMSRFRVAVVPFLLVLVGGSVSRRLPTDRSVLTITLTILGLIALIALWIINFPEVVTVVRFSWSNLDCRTP